MRPYYTLSDYPHGMVETETSGSRMAAGQTEYHGMPVGAGFKVSAVDSTREKERATPPELFSGTWPQAPQTPAQDFFAGPS